MLQRRLLVVARRGRWQPVWQVCSQGWSCPRPTTSPRPKAVNGPSRAAKVHKGPRTKWPPLTWSRDWRRSLATRRRPPTSSSRTSPTQGLASRLTKMASSTPLSLDASSPETLGTFLNYFGLGFRNCFTEIDVNHMVLVWRCQSPSKPEQTMSFKPSTTHQKRKRR